MRIANEFTLTIPGEELEYNCVSKTTYFPIRVLPSSLRLSGRLLHTNYYLWRAKVWYSVEFHHEGVMAVEPKRPEYVKICRCPRSILVVPRRLYLGACIRSKLLISHSVTKYHCPMAAPSVPRLSGIVLDTGHTRTCCFGTKAPAWSESSRLGRLKRSK